MLLVGVPLSSLSIDVTRIMYVRGHLQTALDALDTPPFIATGEARINAGLERSWAWQVFSATLSDSGQVRYTYRIGIEGYTCAMLRYAEWFGVWHNYHKSFSWQKLQGGDHSAFGDCYATLDVIRKMAESK